MTMLVVRSGELMTILSPLTHEVAGAGAGISLAGAGAGAGGGAAEWVRGLGSACNDFRDLDFIVLGVVFGGGSSY